MQQTIERIFDEVEHRYLPPESLKQVHHYVKSLPERITAYRTLRERETLILQKVADQLEKTFPQKSQDDLERSLRYAMLALRQAAMAMLMDDITHLDEQLTDWLGESMTIHNTRDVDRVLYGYLKKVLVQALPAKHFTLLSPLLDHIQTAVMPGSLTSAPGAAQPPVVAAAL
jgi:Phycobilisome protein